MNQRLISEIGRTQRLDIINSLKRTKGMSVNELVERMRMSYMGIKQHCITLHRDGYLDTWRRPQKWDGPRWCTGLRAAATIFSRRIVINLLWMFCKQPRKSTGQTRRRSYCTMLSGRRP